MRIENIDLAELKAIVREVVEIKSQPEFIRLYGNHSLTDEQYLFYQHSLIYHAQKRLRSSVRENPAKVFSWMSFLKSQPEFIRLYGNIDFNSTFIYQQFTVFQLLHYTGNLSFWSRWSTENGFEKEFVKNFLSLYAQAVESTQFKEILESMYGKIGIIINLDLENKSYEMKEEIQGIISNWILYFYLRGIDSQNTILSSLNEINVIANLSCKYRLNYTQDDLRYWFQHKNESGYSMKEIEEIFYLMSGVEKILVQSVEKLRQIPEIQPYLVTLKPHLDEIKNKRMHPGEIQRLAEEILYPQKVEIEELIEEYTIGVLIQALYLSELDTELTPYEVTEIFTFIKKEGLGIEDLIKLVKTEETIYRVLKESGFYPIFRESELRKFIWQNVYQRDWKFTTRYFQNWIPKLILFLEEFKKEHNCYPSKRLLYSLLDYHAVNAPDWQLTRMIQNGTLSYQAKNPLVVNLGQNWNIKRELLFFCYEHLPIGLDVENLDTFIYYFLNLNFYHYQTFLELEKKLEENMAQVIIANGTSQPEEVMKKIINHAFPMLGYVDKHQEVFRERVRQFSQRSKNGFKKIHPNTPFQEMLKVPQKRVAIIKSVKDTARKYYNIELSPARTYSMIWKMREGYLLRNALGIFVGDYKRLKEIYRKSLSREITGNINNLILHLCQQIYLTPLEIEDCEKIFLTMHQLQIINAIYINTEPNSYQTYRNAETIYFTGLEAGDLNKIVQFLQKVKEYLPRECWETVLYLCLRSFKSQPYYTPGITIYSYEDYCRMLEKTEIRVRNIIPYLNKNNISPQGYYYFYLGARYYSRRLKLKSGFEKSILASLLYEKTKDPYIVKTLLSLKTDAEAYAYLKKINKIVARKKRELIRENISKQCKF